jgi:hypothetical protein
LEVKKRSFGDEKKIEEGKRGECETDSRKKLNLFIILEKQAQSEYRRVSFFLRSFMYNRRFFFDVVSAVLLA